MSEIRLPFSREEIIRSVSDEIAKIRKGGVYAIYVRLSRFDPDDPGYSLDFQPDRSEEFARSENATEIRIYSDPGRSGKNSKRDELQRMLNDIKAGRIDVVVFHRIDRVFRNLESLLKFVKILKRYNVRFVSITEQIDTDTWWGRLVLAVLGSLAEAYVWQVSDRTREGLAVRRSIGLHLGRLPFGYCSGLCSTCDDVNGRGYCPLHGGADRSESHRGRISIPHPIDRYAIPLIKDLCLDGKSFREISNFLNNNTMKLPDGSEALFRPRGKMNGKHPPRFTRESIRAILENPFYTGQVARYRRPEFSLEDDLEHPENILPARIDGNSREVLELFQGQHEPLISFADWQAIQSTRAQRLTTPAVSNRAVRLYPLSGVARCWECFEEMGQEFTLRGSTGGKGILYYRCAYSHDQSLKRKRKTRSRMEGINPVVNSIDDTLAKRHKTLRADKLESQIDQLVSRLVIPSAWDDWIAAYYLSDDGMAEFERAGYGYRLELKNLHRLFESEQVSRPEFERRVRALQNKLNALSPTSNPDVSGVLDGYRSFGNVWTQLDNGEKRNILGVMFDSLFFDREGRLVRAVAYEPFRELLGLPEDGMITEL